MSNPPPNCRPAEQLIKEDTDKVDDFSGHISSSCMHAGKIAQLVYVPLLSYPDATTNNCERPLYSMVPGIKSQRHVSWGGDRACFSEDDCGDQQSGKEEERRE